LVVLLIRPFPSKYNPYLHRPDTSEAEEDALREALLHESSSTTDPESSTKRPSRKSSWVSLVGVAARYMWPTGLGLQIRASVCVVLIVVVRLLNLAVPLLYKKVRYSLDCCFCLIPRGVLIVKGTT
jgi:hypothetical protein